MKDLIEIRQEIDDIDCEIVRLYQQRMVLTEQVAEYKIRMGKAVLDREREASKLEKLSAMAATDFEGKGIRALFEQIMDTSRNRQYQLLALRGVQETAGFCPAEQAGTEGCEPVCGSGAEDRFQLVEQVDASGCSIVYQGVEGAYSQQAMRAFFGEGCDGRSFHVDTWRQAMEAIKNGEAGFAVLPIENSSAGIVPENYDLLAEYDNPIVGEQIIPVEHALLGVPGAKLEDICRVYSHPQALMQCSRYLEEHRQWQGHAMKNTAVSARKVMEDGDIHQAAIAGEINAGLYGLEVLARRIQNNQNNFTRFIIVTGDMIYTRAASRVSLCFEIPHESGSLYRILGHFIYNGLNMTNIQSRPMGDRPWEYRFFLDFEGRLEDLAVRTALRGLREETIAMKILGTM